MPKKYALIGAPGAGKTAVALVLEIVFQECVIKEAAEDYIRFRQSQGKPDPWTEEDFQDRIVDLQLQRFEKIHNKRAFCDTTPACGLAYVKKGSPAYNRIKKRIRTDFETVFLIQNLGKTQQTTVRKENHKQALIVEKNLIKIYRDLGFEPVLIPPDTPENRAKIILDFIGS